MKGWEFQKAWKQQNLGSCLWFIKWFAGISKTWVVFSACFKLIRNSKKKIKNTKHHIISKVFNTILKGVSGKNESGYEHRSKNIRRWLLLILLLSVASIRRKLLKTAHTEERGIHTNSESCNIWLGSILKISQSIIFFSTY